jgi:hypothetical protein
VVAPEREAADVVDIARSVELPGIVGEQETAGEERVVGFDAGHVEQRLEPARFREGVRIQQRNPRAV